MEFGPLNNILPKEVQVVLILWNHKAYGDHLENKSNYFLNSRFLGFLVGVLLSNNIFQNHYHYLLSESSKLSDCKIIEQSIAIHK